MENEYLEQGTQEWRDIRAGFCTASRINDVMAKPRKGQKDSVARKSYLAQIICERLAHKPMEDDRGSFYDVRRGKDLESVARSEYEMRNGVVVDTAGFVKHPTLPWAGCSPDGLIGPKGLVQLKCPRRHIHLLDWVMKGAVPPEHRDQMLFEIACTEREYNDFVSYIDDLDLVPEIQLFQVRLLPDRARIGEIEAAVAEFNAEVEDVMLKLKVKSMSLEEQLRQSLEMVNPRKGVLAP